MMPFDVLSTSHYRGNDSKDKYSLLFAKALLDCPKREKRKFCFLVAGFAHS